MRRATARKNLKRRCLPISIHALLAESDRKLPIREPTALHFYPRSPCGERPYRQGEERANQSISIHALLAESDYLGAGQSYDVCHFYPRSPCGERPVQIVIIVVDTLFLSTLSLRRATGSDRGTSCKTAISIHALLAESDQRHLPDNTHRRISIHALLAESDNLHPGYCALIH